MSSKPPPAASSPHHHHPDAVVFEAHITDLIRKDARWRQLWSLFLKACTIPDAAPAYPGHHTQKDTKQGKLHREELARCYKEPSPFSDGLNELKQKVFSPQRQHQKRSSSVSSFLHRGAAHGGGHQAEWQAYKGRFLRVAPTPLPPSSGVVIEDEEAFMRELLATLLNNTTNTSHPPSSSSSSSMLDDHDVRSRGFAYFPPHGYQAWRKNAFDKAGSYRLVLVHNVPTGRSFFRYRHPSTGLVQALPMVDGTVRVFRVAAASSLWHCTTAEDGHLWSLSYQLSPTAASKVLSCLRPVAPLVPVVSKPSPLKIPAKEGGDEGEKKSTTPLAVSFLFGHRRHPLPGQQEGGGGGGGRGLKVPTPSSGGSSRGGSRRNSRNLTLKRNSRSLEENGGGGVEEDEETKAGEGDDLSYSHYEDAEGYESEMEASTATSCAWVRSGELSSGSDLDEEDLAAFRDVRLNEVPGA